MRVGKGIVPLTVVALIGFAACETDVSDEVKDYSAVKVFEIDNSASSEDDSNNPDWQTANWQEVAVPLALGSEKSVKYKIEVLIDPCATAGTNPYVRIDDAVFKTSAGANLLANGEFTDTVTPPDPPSPNQFNSWPSWHVWFEKRSAEWGSAFSNTDPGYGLGDTGKVTAWCGGGNYTLTVEQTVNAPAGDYTASAMVLIGNVKGKVTISAISQ